MTFTEQETIVENVLIKTVKHIWKINNLFYFRKK